MTSFIDGLPALLVAAAALVLALAGAWQIWRAVSASAGEGFAVYWQVGGFGTPGRGWRVSPPLVQLLAGLALVAAAVAIAPAVGGGAAGKPAAASAAGASPASAPASSPASAPAAPASAASR